MVKFGRITKNKSWEVQVELPSELPDWFDFQVQLSSKCDHAGFRIKIELLKLFFFEFAICDNRHWDYDNDRWETYED